jgi:hypothetical protein
VVADWLFSSFDTRPRQKSDDSVSKGLKCARANVDFPHPDAPIITTSDISGMTIVRGGSEDCAGIVAVSDIGVLPREHRHL